MEAGGGEEEAVEAVMGVVEAKEEPGLRVAQMLRAVFFFVYSRILYDSRFIAFVLSWDLPPRNDDDDEEEEEECDEEEEEESEMSSDEDSSFFSSWWDWYSLICSIVFNLLNLIECLFSGVLGRDSSSKDVGGGEEVNGDCSGMGCLADSSWSCGGC